MHPKLNCFLILLLTTAARTQRGCPSQEVISPCRCSLRGQQYQIWCSHSDLPRVLAGLKAVAQHIKHPIDELILENNFLPSLPGRTFFPLHLLRLMLRNNGLARVSSDWLSGLESSLMEIFIVEPQLTSLPDDCMLRLNALKAVTIQTKLLKRLPFMSGLAKLKYVRIESESLLELTPANFKKNLGLEKLHIKSSPRLTKLEANLFRDLPKLNLINFTDCAISWIHPRALSRLPLLKEISLVGNKLTDASMIGRISRDLPQLEVIRLDNNYIENIGEAAFVNLPTLKKIYLSNNRVKELHRGAFHRVPSLRSIDLNMNSIRRIHPEMFLQLSDSSLEELSLIKNDIRHVAELQSLLDALPRLVFLDMSFNHLEAIPFGALRGHPTLEHINLGYNKIKQIDKEAFMAMPALRELRLRNNLLSDALEPPFWNLPALKGLDLSKNLFRRTNPRFLINLPSLRRIDLSENQLGFLDPALFLPTPSLEHVNISHNSLKILHPATFRHLLNLYELDASHNQLFEFTSGLPIGIEYLHLHHNEIVEIPTSHSPDVDLPALKMLDLSYNRIQRLAKGALRALPQLKRLYLGKNLLQELEETSLAGLGRLESIDLQENRLVQIHPNSLKGMTELKDVSLKNNRLDLLAHGLFRTSSRLKKIDLSGNRLAEILSGTLERNLEIEVLDVSSNVLVQLPQTVYRLSRLKTLDLTNNRIKNIDPSVIRSMTKIKDLKLSKNFAHELKEGAFNNLQSLKTINMDNNELEYIEPNAVRALPALNALKLNKNKILEIPNYAFNNLPSLQTVELQENNLKSIAPNAFHLVPHLVVLNLSHNHIFNINEAGLRSVISLEVLDLSYNKIYRLTSSNMEKLEWLVELRMDDNNICGIQGSPFKKMSRLRVLSLKNNKMISFAETSVHRLRGNIAVLDIDGNPLACTCRMLWLQAWLQESSQQGPRCKDGSLFRELRLSRQNCLEEGEADKEMKSPGCDAEVLSPSENYDTSQVFSKWTVLKNISNDDGSGSKHNLAPSPEESDYFYDDYIDYPYNESLIDIDGFVGTSKDKELVAEQVHVSTNSPNNIPGNTFTIYAAPKNKTKTNPNIPPTVSNSPSTSGFTFFGVPLADFNLNNFLGGRGGTGRMEDKTPVSTMIAERKTAIVNDPIRNTGRVSMGNIQSHYVHTGNVQMRGVPSIVNMQPPTPPHFQSGFLPVVPGYGGFKPITNPATQLSPPAVPLRNTTTHFKNSENSRDTTNLRQSLYFKSTNLTKTHIKNPSQDLIQSLSKLNYTAEHIFPSLPGIVNSTFKTIKQTHLESKIDVVSANASETVVEIIPAQIKEITTQNPVAEQTTEPEMETETYEVNTPPLVTTEEAVIETSTFKHEETSLATESTVTDQKHEESAVEKSGTTLSVLLVPGGQQPQFKQAGRSTITKVPSPHISLDDPLQAHIESAPVLQPLPHREGKQTHDYSVSVTSEGAVKKTDDDKDWYFANYNKTDLEPFVAKIVNISAGCGMARQYWSVMVIFYIHIVWNY